MLQRIRNTLIPQPLSGRVRFVLVSMGIAAAAGAWLFVLDESSDGHWLTYLVPLAFAGLAAVAAYSIALVFAVFNWVLAGFDERSQLGIHRFLMFGVVATFLAVLLVMLRHETTGPYQGPDGCWYMQRDRWTGAVTMKNVTCPAESRPKRQFI